MTSAVIVGVDGCKTGWIVVHRYPDTEPSVTVFPSFAALLDALPADATAAVDMPIGLPDFSQRGGRGPEALVRPLLGDRQSSVFSIPSRAALCADTNDFTTIEAWYAAHRRASDVAKATSDPPRGVSIQAFGIFAKIREIDALLIARPDLRNRVYESHPEVAFCRLNGKPMRCRRRSRASSIRLAWKSARRCCADTATKRPFSINRRHAALPPTISSTQP